MRSRQDGRRLTGRAPIGASGRTGRADPGEKVAESRPPSFNGTLPAGYGKTRIVLLPVDPYLVHVYWEVSGSGTGFVKALVEAGALRPQAILRFHDVTAMPVGGVRAEGSFDVEVGIESRNWYVRLLSPEKSYVVDLGFRGRDGSFHRIARSNRGKRLAPGPVQKRDGSACESWRLMESSTRTLWRRPSSSASPERSRGCRGTALGSRFRRRTVVQLSGWAVRPW